MRSCVFFVKFLVLSGCECRNSFFVAGGLVISSFDCIQLSFSKQCSVCEKIDVPQMILENQTKGQKTPCPVPIVGIIIL